MELAVVIDHTELLGIALVLALAGGAAEALRLAEKDDILCAIRDVNTTVCATGFHSHHVVAADTLWKFTDKSSSAFHIPYVLKRCAETEEIKRLIDEFIYSSHIYENSPGRTAELFLRIF